MSKDTGGPAFPTGIGLNADKTWIGSGSGGMTLRDYFAAKAMQGLLANPKLQDQILKEGGAFGGWVEHSAYGWADAMLEARKQ
jgi:hypothetical protein